MPRGRYPEGGFCGRLGFWKTGFGHIVVFVGFPGGGTSKREKPHWQHRARRSRRCNWIRKSSSFSAAGPLVDKEKFRAAAAMGTRSLVRLTQRRKVRSLMDSSPSPFDVTHCKAWSTPSLSAIEDTSRQDVMVALPRHNSAGCKDLVLPSQKMTRRTGTFSNTSPLHRSWMIFRNQVPWYLAQSAVPH